MLEVEVIVFRSKAGENQPGKEFVLKGNIEGRKWALLLSI